MTVGETGQLEAFTAIEVAAYRDARYGNCKYLTCGDVLGRIISRLSYLSWIVTLPFVIDVLFHLEVKFSLPPLLRFPWSGLASLALLVPAFFLIVRHPQVNPSLEFPTIAFALWGLSLIVIVLWPHGQSSVGYYTAILAAVLLAILIVPPSTSETDQAVDVFAALLSVTIVISFVVLLVAPSSFATVHPIRHPWATSLPWQILRVDGLFRGPGVFGLYSCLLICIASTRASRMAVPYTIIGSAGLLLSDSRSAVLALLISEIAIVARLARADGVDLLRSTKAKVATFGLLLALAYLGTLGVDGLMYGSAHRASIYAQALTTGAVETVDGHPHNFVLSALFLHSAASVLLIAVIVTVVITGALSFFSGTLLAIALLGPVVIYSSFEFGVHWSRLNLPTMALLLGLLSTRLNHDA